VSELKRKKNESFEAFMRRVKDQWKKSGKILQARKIMYFMRDPSKTMRHKQALEKIKTTDKQTYLRKIGKLPAKDNNYSNR